MMDSWTFKPFHEYSLPPDIVEEAKRRGVALPEPVRNLSNSGSAFVYADDGIVCEVYIKSKFKRGQGHKAECSIRDDRARLIAAAPDLYEALKGLLAKVECGSALNCELCDAARAALAKASPGVKE